MLLYLIRHAHALSEEQDPGRPLSPKGRAQIKRLTKFLGDQSAFAPTEIWHSPLTRSRQTARLLAQALAPRAALAEVAGLEPEQDARLTLKRLKPSHTALAIVGHEPHLSVLAALLVTGAPNPGVFKLRKASVLCLDHDADAPSSLWRTRWLLDSELLVGL
jgi:phosphohistidine phosphatase